MLQRVPSARNRGGGCASRAANAGTSEVKWVDWDTALAGIENLAVVGYSRQQLEANRESYLRYPLTQTATMRSPFGLTANP